MNNNGKSINILIVEDNPGDVMLIRENLLEIKISNNLHTVKDGQEAMDYLYHRGAYAGVDLPDLILLDLNLPKKSGQEVLAEIKGDPALKQIPVIVLTSSEAHEDISKAYGLHANCYITKPGKLDDYIRVIQAIESFWITIVKLPHA